MTDSLDHPLRQAVETATLVGVAAMAATSKGPIHAAAFGLRDPKVDAAMTIDSVGWIASMTKAITSVAALRLVEQDLLSLDDTICDELPELTAPMVLDRFGTDGAPIMHPAPSEITLRQLLSHTAGYGYDTWNPAIWHLRTHLGLPRIPKSLEDLRQLPLLFDPGTRWNYGINIDIVGRAIEVVTGQSLSDHLRETIFEPLGMSDTMFLLNKAHQDRRIVMHQHDDDGVFTRIPWSLPDQPPFLLGGGGLYSTANDYIKFLRAILTGDKALLGPDMFEALTTNQIGELDVTPMLSAAPNISANVDFHPEQRLKWTLGFMLNTQPTPQGRSANSLSWAGLSNCYYWIDRTRDVCGVFITGLLPFGDPGARKAFADYETAVYRSLG